MERTFFFRRFPSRTVSFERLSLRALPNREPARTRGARSPGSEVVTFSDGFPLRSHAPHRRIAETQDVDRLDSTLWQAGSRPTARSRRRMARPWPSRGLINKAWYLVFGHPFLRGFEMELCGSQILSFMFAKPLDDHGTVVPIQWLNEVRNGTDLEMS